MNNEEKIIDLLEKVLDKLDYIAASNMDTATNTSSIMEDVSAIKEEIENKR